MTWVIVRFAPIGGDYTEGTAATKAAEEHVIEQLANRNCPLCRSNEHTGFLNVYRHNVLSHLAKCAKCSFVFVTDPRIDTADDDELTADFEPGERARHGQIDHLIRTLFPRVRPFVVEVGAGFGQLGERLQGFADYVGFEPASNRAAAAQKTRRQCYRATLRSRVTRPGRRYRRAGQRS